MNQRKALNLLGLAMRAGKIISGEELTLKAIRSQELSIVLVAKDASENTRKKFKDKCSYYHIRYTELFSQEEISHSIGKYRMICGVNDEGFARKIYELIQ